MKNAKHMHMPKIIELWGLNVQTDVSSKKTSPN